jgi:Uma2 family endonuclease
MASLAPKYQSVESEPSFDALRYVDHWTADLALKLLPETNRPRVEVFRGSVVVSPHASVDHQIVAMNLGAALKPPARAAGLWLYPEVNVRSGDDLFIPDLCVLRRSGAGRIVVDIQDAVLLVEIVSASNRRKDLIDRPRTYAEAAVPWFIRVEVRRQIPEIVLFELIEGAYRPIVTAAGDTRFSMTEPFEFSIDPAELLDD